MKKLVITQSNYIPWKGYFDLIAMADECILYDTVQYTKQDWRNRNLIKTKQNTKWLTIPVAYHKTSQRICDTHIAYTKWGRKHWNKITSAYGKTPYFPPFESMFKQLYQELSEEPRLGCVNASFIRHINSILGINTNIITTPEFIRSGEKNTDLITLCKMRGADTYLVAPKAKSYIDEAKFADAGIRVEWMQYEGYPTYHQMHPPFTHYVSIIDLLFNEGLNSKHYMLYSQRQHVQTRIYAQI